MLDPLEIELQILCELPCGGWKSNLGPVQELQVLLNTKPALQFPIIVILDHIIGSGSIWDCINNFPVLIRKQISLRSFQILKIHKNLKNEWDSHCYAIDLEK